MNLDAFVTVLTGNPHAALHLMLPDGSFVPAHFHVTEVGRVQKDFIDCGGTIRSTTTCVLQVWVATDSHHRLDTTKLAKIIQIGTPLFPSMTLPVEVEYEPLPVVADYRLSPVPEPTSLILAAMGGLGLSYWRRRQLRSAATA